MTTAEMRAKASGWWAAARPWVLAFGVALILFVCVCVVYYALRWPAVGASMGVTNRDQLKGQLDTAMAIITAFATLALFLAALFGLQQLRLAKRDLRIRSRREARSIAIAQCERFAKEIIEPTNVVSKALSVAGIPPFDIKGLPLDFDSSNVLATKRALEWVVKVSPESQKDCIGILNTLETWAMNFTLLIADAESAYPPAANVFCTIVLQLYPFILILRQRNDPGLFPNVKRLFDDWKGRKNAEGMQRKMQQRMAEFKAIQDVPPHPRPLGDEI